MTEPDPPYPTTNGTYPDVELCTPPDRKQLYDAYRSAVSTAYLLQGMLGLPPEKRAVFTSKERRDLGI